LIDENDAWVPVNRTAHDDELMKRREEKMYCK